ncbi:MAG: hypothetical protein K2Q11_00375 [Burkholderiaceae bacterium]|nr:hypothetical protein [Burkholderiaceae bacterium]
MTCRYKDSDWRDVLYNSVRTAPGGVVDAARFLTMRRGRSIHAETLRARLRGTDENCVTLEMAALLTEWMQDMKHPSALDWLHTFNARFGLTSNAVSVVDSGQSHANQLVMGMLSLGVHGGKLSAEVMAAVEDNVITAEESVRLLELVRDKREVLGQVEAIAMQAIKV